MPRTLLHAPGHDRVRSLGWLGTAWMEFFVRHGPGAVRGRPVRHGDEYTGFIVDCYALNARGRMLYNSAFLSRPKGCDKSGLGGRFCLFEGFGPCRFAGWAAGGEVYTDPWGLGFAYRYERGEPMGKHIASPFVRIMATEEGQTTNTYRTVYYNLVDEDCPLAHVPGIDPGLTKVLLPWGGEIRTSTAASASKDGGLETHCCYDESHLYDTPELREMYDTVRRNLKKREGEDSWFLETTTMFEPGRNSVAEATFGEAEALREGRKRRGRHRLLYDHRWGQVKDTADEALLRAGLIDAYGDAMAWIDLDALVDEFYDTRSTEAKSVRYFLNAQTAAADGWLTPQQWDACARAQRSLKRKDMVCLGMDGSVRDDATAIVAIRVCDGHMELLGCWERPANADEQWQVDREAVDACIAQAMARFEVVGLYCDPAHWQDYVDRWTNEWGAKMQVRATERHPLEWWTNRPRAMVSALERFHEAVVEERVSFTPASGHPAGSPQARLADTLRRHALNARRRPSRAGLQIGKEHPHSAAKIDAVMAAVLAYDAVGQAIAKGIKPRSALVYAARRIR